MNRGMPESGLRTDVHAAALQQLQVGVEANPPERDDDLDVGQRGELGLEMGKAVGDLVGGRLVIGRRAADRGGDERVAQLQAVARVARGRDVRESGALYVPLTVGFATRAL